MKPWVVVPCSGAKADDARLPAGERYTGSFHRAAMVAARRITEDDRLILIASARYGLIALDEVTEPYDRRLDALGHDDLRQWLGWVQCDAGSRWTAGRYAVRTMNGIRPRAGRPGAPVILFTPAFYTEKLLTIPLIARHAVRPLPFEGCGGIGEMRHVLSTYTYKEEP